VSNTVSCRGFQTPTIKEEIVATFLNKVHASVYTQTIQ
jgi:hypothetical protein